MTIPSTRDRLLPAIYRREHDFILENIVNRIHRHCKIRNLVWKARSVPSVIPGSFDPFKMPNIVQYFGPEPRKCACLPGQACGNVACPYHLTATCGPNMSQMMGNC